MALEIIVGTKVAEFLIKKFAGKKIDDWLSDKKRKKELAIALDDTLADLAGEGFEIKGYGKIDESFLKNEAVTNELWGKLLDPSKDEEIDYEHLAKALEPIYENFSADQETCDALEYFADILADKIWKQSSLYELRQSKIIKQLDDNLTLLAKKKLVLDYLKNEGPRIKEELEFDLGEGNRYVEPVIEKKIADRQPMPFPVERDDMIDEKAAERFEAIDVTPYFIDGKDPRCAVVADSGFGKTTLLRELFRRIANTSDTSGSIPIFMTPSQAKECSEINIREKVITRLIPCGMRENKIRKFVNDEFHSGRFLFLIDALDQVSDRQNLIGALEGSCFGNNRIVVTTRPGVWESGKDSLRAYAELHIRQFDESHWEKYLGKEKLAKFREIVDDEFLAVPILLKLVAEYWAVEEDVEAVRNRADLYKKMFDRLLKRPEGRRAREATRARERPPVSLRNDLRKLAHDTLCRNHLGQFERTEGEGILNEDKLLDLEAHGGILNVIETGAEMAFRHRSFQEFLAAEFLKEALNKNGYDFQAVRSYIYHPNWEEPLRFLAGLLDGEKAEKLVEIILDTPESEPLTLYREHLRLAAICLSEMKDHGQLQENRIFENIKMDIHSELYREYAFSILIASKTERAVDLLIDVLWDEDKDSDVRRGAADALGKIKSERTVDSLIEVLRDKDEDSNIRKQAASALSVVKSERAVDSLIDVLTDKDEDPHIRGRAAPALCNIKSERAIDLLIEVLKDKDENSDVRESTADVLGKIKSDRAVNLLIEVLMDKDEDSDIRRSAAFTIWKTKLERFDDSLIEILKDRNEDSRIRYEVAIALSNINSERVVNSLIEALRDEDSYVRGGAAHALGRIKSERAIDSLIDVLKDKGENLYVRFFASHFLGDFNSERAVDSLIEVLKDKKEDSNIRFHAVFALGNIKSEHVVDFLIDLLVDMNEDKFVRGGAAYALGDIKSKRAEDFLIEALKDKKPYVRQGAARALGDIKSERAVDLLAEALKDKSFYVRDNAAYALEVMCKYKILKLTTKALNEIEDAGIKIGILRVISSCDRKIRSQQTIETPVNPGEK